MVGVAERTHNLPLHVLGTHCALLAELCLVTVGAVVGGASCEEASLGERFGASCR